MIHQDRQLNSPEFPCVGSLRLERAQFKATDLLDVALVNHLRMKGYALLFASRLLKRPLQTGNSCATSAGL